MEKQIKDLEEITKIQCSDGNWNYDEYMHGMANGLILSLATIKNEDPVYLKAPPEWKSKYNSVDQLTQLQAELGYVPGEISTVAMLGLVGEAGEVLAETSFATIQESYAWHLHKTIQFAKALDELKKEVRKGNADLNLFVSKEKNELFDAELADVFYYINILATNRGLTIFDLAQMAHDKVRAKQAAGGSSEDPKKS